MFLDDKPNIPQDVSFAKSYRCLSSYLAPNTFPFLVDSDLIPELR